MAQVLKPRELKTFVLEFKYTKKLLKTFGLQSEKHMIKKIDREKNEGKSKQ